MTNSPFYNDLHLHTNLSPCASRTADVNSYYSRCENEGIKVLGISNHIYSDENANAASALRGEITELNKCGDVKVLLGGEIEITPQKNTSMSAETAKQFDYVLIAASHVSRNDYPDVDYLNPRKMREILLSKFHIACDADLGIPCGICHPFYPNGAKVVKEIIDGITDEELSDCFSHAAKKGKSIEIHASVARNDTPLNKNGLSDVFLRVLSAAKAEGCRFHFGTDSHSYESFVNSHKALYLAAEKLGLNGDDIWETAKI